MGLSWKSIGKGLKKVGSVALPVIGGLVGGPLGAAAGGALSGAIGNGKPKLGNIVGGALTGALTGGTGAALVKGGTSALAKDGVTGLLRNVGTSALKNPDLLMAGLSGLEGYKSDKRADALRKQQQQMAMANWNQTAPLRTMGQSQMMDQSLEAMPYAINRQNPFAS